MVDLSDVTFLLLEAQAADCKSCEPAKLQATKRLTRLVDLHSLSTRIDGMLMTPIMRCIISVSAVMTS